MDAHEDKPLTFKPKDCSDLIYFKEQWWSGSRGGGFVPDSFEWPTNPKEWQEEGGYGGENK